MIGIEMKRNENAGIEDIRINMENPAYIMKCQYAINIVVLKLKMIQQEMMEEYRRNVVSNICNRIKTPESIKRKLIKKKREISFRSAEENLNDIVGVRATCFFEDDIYEMVKRFKAHKDIKTVKEKDYIKRPKLNGYHSFHLIVDVPVYTDGEDELKRVEIQFRTVAMDFWAQLDYQLCYKRAMDEPQRQEIQRKLSRYANDIVKMDQNMLKIRKQIENIGV